MSAGDEDRTSDSLVIVVDDDTELASLLGQWIGELGLSVELCGNGEQCLSLLRHRIPSLVLLDLHMPGIGGMETLRRLRVTHAHLPIIILTADENLETAVTALKLGAFDYLVKPILQNRLLTAVRNAVDRGTMALRLMHLEREAAGEGYGRLVGSSEPMRLLYRNLDRLAACDATVLIKGESGSGKELVAREIHDNSGRHTAPFVALDCAVLPDGLQEAGLFGFERGAFTGAEQRRIGLLEEADGGTLFLDEVGELNASLQGKLLRVLQERSFRRIGGGQEIHSDFRLLAATNRNLEEDVHQGRFREDLFFRLAVFELEVPPLRRRAEDVLPLAQHFLDRYGAGTHPVLTLAAGEVLQSYRWPGNVRELENAMQHALVVAKHRQLSPESLPPRLRRHHKHLTSPQTTSPARQTHSPRTPSAGYPVMSLAEAERQTIENAVTHTEGNLSEAARLLGIGRTTLYRKLRQYRLE